MPLVALVLIAFWFATLFVLRTALQWLRTGSTGMKGFHGRVGSIPWLAGATTTTGFALALVTPPAALLGWPGGGLLFQQSAWHGLGVALSAVGIIGALIAQLEMGESWRIGVDEGERTALVTDGLYARVRNPIFSFIALSLVGLVLMVPNVYAIASALLTFIGIELQVHRVEEPHLEHVHGASYRSYATRVGRFVPGVGRLRAMASTRTGASD